MPACVTVYDYLTEEELDVFETYYLPRIGEWVLIGSTFYKILRVMYAAKNPSAVDLYTIRDSG